MAIATRASRRGGSETPIQIRAQLLRDWPVHENVGPMSGFAIIPEDEALRPVDRAMLRGRNWRQRDAERAMGAAQQAGLARYRVEISPDGTISIIVGEA